MKALLLLQALWAAGITLVGALSVANAASLGRSEELVPPLVLAALGVAYLYVTSRLWHGADWAWWASLVLPVFGLANSGPRVALNLWMAAHGHPLFQDSPGTLIVVAIEAILVVVPAAVLLVILLLARRRLTKRWSGP